MRFDLFKPSEAILPCLTAAEALAHNKNVKISSQLPETPFEIRSDRDGFQTIASNLISNAVRYTPSEGTVTVELSQQGEECCLTVADTGVGINPEDLERIFERFYRAEKDRSVETGGTGLGLSIVKHLVQALEGKVTADSEPGHGSRFEVRLPISIQKRV